MDNDKKDHREIAKELELYLLNEEIGQGLPILLTDFVFLRNKLASLIREKWKKYGFMEVITPILGNKNLFLTSEHLQHYEKYMFPSISRDQEDFYLRPMTCPHHCLVYCSKPRSYRELPFRLAENSWLFRYETSGSLKGLERVRSFECADHHIFVRLEQLVDEIKKNFYFVQEILISTDLKIDRLICSLHNPLNKEKYHEDKKLWELAESTLLQTLEELKRSERIEYVVQNDEAAFYGPKIDFEVLTQTNKQFVTVSTIQLDFFLPKKFDLKYLDNKQKTQQPIIIHQTPIGAYQRFLVLLLEQKQGKLPIWMVPCQLVILLINTKDVVYGLAEYLVFSLESEIRIKIWEKKRLNFYIKQVFQQKIPYYLVIGTSELLSKTFYLTDAFSGKKIKIEYENLVETLKNAIHSR